MKLLPTLLASSYGMERGLSPLQAIMHAHRRVRNGFTIPVMDEISAENERILNQVFNERSTEPLDVMVERAVNVTESFERQGNCGSSFPSLDGSCNASNDKGRSMKAYTRLVSANYCNGRDSPRCASNGGQLPSERAISLAMRANTQRTMSNDVSYAFTAWGQFITHDIIQTPDVLGSGDVPCDCSGTAPQCKEISLDNDPVITFPCLFIIRSSSQLGQSGQGTPVREQINQLSAYLDATTVYGFTTKHRKLLTASDGMHLRMQSVKGEHFLPSVNMFNDNGIKDKFSTSSALNDKGHDELVAGDTRVLENPLLSSLHTLFARLHNNAVDQLRAINPGWNKERVFEEARLFVIGVMKEINYSEHLPLMVGNPGMAVMNNIGRGKKNKNKKRTNPDGHVPPSQDDPSIRNEFAAAAYRFGHSMVPDNFKSANTDMSQKRSAKLENNFFDPDLLFRDGAGACLRGMASMEAAKVGGHYAEATNHKLFKPNTLSHGVDLLAINLARGREHGLGTYNALRDWCMNHEDYGIMYNGLPSMQNGWNNIRNMYNNDGDIDLYVGLLMEQPMQNAQVGPTAGCIIVDQFLALRDGDKFHHENGDVFSSAQLSTLKGWTLSKALCNAMEGMGNIQANMFKKSGTGPTINCNSRNMAGMNLEAWRDDSAQSGAPAGNEGEDVCQDRFGNTLDLSGTDCTCKQAQKNKCPGICRDPRNNGAEVAVPEGCTCKQALKNRCPPPAGFCFHKKQKFNSKQFAAMASQTANEQLRTLAQAFATITTSRNSPYCREARGLQKV
ncbi:Oidioi.mRNA.OKI2018_I69.chr1.g514.t1.cds [Oikopleura dioica]|uniref:Oidioi.mRNA.OKI2018_I69.chr1.g514.t1.cds n=1 Tax=Oikopleura dioica TaxID=34765 RepID=A0ABN7SLS7_OIKDI|nr:Oidioi.mRNA.OKI2018_I69.chr1.g514.t1.cds [Oikopleura dioica]